MKKPKPIRRKRRSIEEICAEIRTLKLKVKPNKTYKEYFT